MNRKFEDELLRLAFEDMTPEQASRLEQEAKSDPEAARVLSQYREMRAGLRALADVPAEQLSKERLRDAILTGGLAPRRSPKLGWAWMPVMAASLAAVVFLVRPHASPTPQVAVARHENIFDVPSVTPPAPVAMNNPSRTEAASGIAIDVHPIVPQKQLVSLVIRRGHHRGSSTSDRDLLRTLENFVPVPPVTVPAAPRGNTSAPPMAASPASSDNPPVVLIDGEKDTNTGASRATEVESTSNVVVGG